jgi:hypothetical protein
MHRGVEDQQDLITALHSDEIAYTFRRPMKRIFLRKFLPWLLVAFVVAFCRLCLKFRTTPVTAHTVVAGEVRAEVMGTGTLEARVKTTISPRIQERLAEVRQNNRNTEPR